MFWTTSVSLWFWIYCRKNVIIRFARRTDIMPPVPLETKYHPSAVDILLIKRLITETSRQTLLQFLQHEFVNIGKSHAERLIGEHLKLIAFIYLRPLDKTKLVGSQGCLAKDYVHALCIINNGNSSSVDCIPFSHYSTTVCCRGYCSPTQ